MSALLLVIGLLVGAGVVFGWQQSARARERSTANREREALTERAVTAESELRADGRMLDGFKAVAGDTLRLVSREMIQLHGGIGMTDEHDAGFYMKRAAVLEAMWGNAAWHRERFAQLNGY